MLRVYEVKQTGKDILAVKHDTHSIPTPTETHRRQVICSFEVTMPGSDESLRPPRLVVGAASAENNPH